MNLFYNSEIKDTDKEFFFNKEESKHIVKVLRKKEGDILHITNGNGYLFKGEITIASDKKCAIHIEECSFEERNRNYRLHIAIAPTKLNDRYEWFLEKATEIGIDEITPIICKNSERKVIKLERYQKIVQSATKQSLQLYLPKLNKAISFKEFISQENTDKKFIAHCEEGIEKQYLNNTCNPNDTITVLIGPEGDFSSDEITTALSNNFTAISLGANRLRTETAGVYVSTLLTTLNQ